MPLQCSIKASWRQCHRVFSNKESKLLLLVEGRGKNMPLARSWKILSWFFILVNSVNSLTNHNSDALHSWENQIYVKEYENIYWQLANRSNFQIGPILSTYLIALHWPIYKLCCKNNYSIYLLSDILKSKA